MSGLAERAAALLGGRLARAEPVGGGNLSRVIRIFLDDGREAIAKDGPAPLVEAAMLRAIRDTGAPAPEVFGADSATIVMARLPAGGGDADGDLGHAVARLHAVAGESYGWACNYAFGGVVIENGWSEDWPAFWAERRLLCHCPHLDAPLARRIEALAARLADHLPARPRPALLHGDLWGGNVLTDGAVVSGLIDPACYHGHAEVDLAMLTLFGGPGSAFREAYGPAEPGFAERVPIYQLWPALVHLRLFGAGYRGMVEAKLAAAGA
ncbi:fructosamine kinase family protein [Methylobacterium brachythecii]|uniref:Aminoglycoside phosphotransferase n=1 Tax=Methylobacterium brachythecii TaxID=1176177 RepID=A0A7W6ADZ2_9HYPH|nr:fructosamine kinase family protein [Methylobacterium brachythecii]MBB3901540.1 fructosamine-3-kinase [Methylobacterium brachythecii]GLS43110.1 aminoglycoside phosphotransferase [Methylobacterium brachythecii]